MDSKTAFVYKIKLENDLFVNGEFNIPKLLYQKLKDEPMIERVYNFDNSKGIKEDSHLITEFTDYDEAENAILCTLCIIGEKGITGIKDSELKLPTYDINKIYDNKNPINPIKDILFFCIKDNYISITKSNSISRNTVINYIKQNIDILTNYPIHSINLVINKIDNIPLTKMTKVVIGSNYKGSLETESEIIRTCDSMKNIILTHIQKSDKVAIDKIRSALEVAILIKINFEEEGKKRNIQTLFKLIDDDNIMIYAGKKKIEGKKMIERETITLNSEDEKYDLEKIYSQSIKFINKIRSRKQNGQMY